MNMKGLANLSFLEDNLQTHAINIKYKSQNKISRHFSINKEFDMNLYFVYISTL